jgi:hypothetical protein
MSKKDFFINAVRMIDVDGSANIPTVLFYGPKGSIYIGSSALARAKNLKEINAEFKIDLGNIDPTSATPPKRIYTVASGESKSAIGLAGDFLYKVAQYCGKWLEDNSIKSGIVFLWLSR